MSLLYRAIWQDDREDLLAASQESFQRWVEDKTGNQMSNDVGEHNVDGGETRVLKGENEHGRALRVELTEDKDPERWMTRLTILQEADDSSGWVWVDVERESARIFDPFDIAAPRLVRTLLSDAVRPRIGATPLAKEERLVLTDQVEDLCEEILDRGREVPILVVTYDRDIGLDATEQRAQRAAEILAGVVNVVWLTKSAVDNFNNRIGYEMGVWNGAVRLYVPDDADLPSPWRHRYLTSERLRGPDRQAGRAVARMISSRIGARPQPPLYRRLRSELVGGNPEIYEEMIDEQEQELQVARTDADEWMNKYLDVLQELEDQQTELNRQARQLQLARHGADAASIVDVPDEAASCTTAAEQCRQHLSRISLPQECCRDLEDLDKALEGRAWAQKAWQAFRALDAYAADASEVKGTFWHWCDQGTSEWTWPATPKKLAMSESETVMANPQLREKRNLPVDPALDPSGRMTMEAHIKIAEGGGDLAPRIYFHDDTTGPTGKIHIGYFGPHRHMPNTRT